MAMPAPAFLLMFDIGATELLLVAALAVMLYGGELPDVARKAGSTMKRLRGVADDLKRQVQMPPEVAEIKDVKSELKKIPAQLDIRRDISMLPPPPSLPVPTQAPSDEASEPLPTIAPPAKPEAPPAKRESPPSSC
jgi:sec-independent protein translocase protein TatA